MSIQLSFLLPLQIHCSNIKNESERGKSLQQIGHSFSLIILFYVCGMYHKKSKKRKQDSWSFKGLLKHINQYVLGKRLVNFRIKVLFLFSISCPLLFDFVASKQLFTINSKLDGTFCAWIFFGSKTSVGGFWSAEYGVFKFCSFSIRGA